MKPLSALVIVVSLVIIVNALTTLYVIHQDPPNIVETVYMDLTIGEAIGLNIDSDAIHFGTVRPGSSVTKRISLVTDKKMDLTLSADGSINQYIYLPNNPTTLLPHINNTISIVAKVPQNHESGEFNGTLTLNLVEVN